MKKLSVEFDVLNASEVVKERKGRLLGGIAGLFLGKEDLKEKVEQKILEEMILNMEKVLVEKFKEEGVKAQVTVSEIKNRR